MLGQPATQMGSRVRGSDEHRNRRSLICEAGATRIVSRVSLCYNLLLRVLHHIKKGNEFQWIFAITSTSSVNGFGW